DRVRAAVRLHRRPRRGGRVAAAARRRLKRGLRNNDRNGDCLMTTATVTKPPRPVAVNLTMGGVLRSEWTKFRSVRSTWWLLSGTVFLVVGLGVVVAVLEINGGAPKQEPP